jgi:serine protease AprX
MNRKHRAIRRVACAAVAALPVLSIAAPASAESGTGSFGSRPNVKVIVRAKHGLLDKARELVKATGGDVDKVFSSIDGFEAEVPPETLANLWNTQVILAVTPDVPLPTFDAPIVADDAPEASTAVNPLDQVGSVRNVAEMVNADDMWNRGYSGKGVDVAVIDTGVAPVPGMATQYVNGPDLSLDALGNGSAGNDAYGHGTVMASIIAGRDDNTPSDPRNYDRAGDSSFIGIAPGARVVNVKVGAFDGATDVSQVIAAIDWVVQHKNDNGMNIRVLNLSFGTDGVQDYVLDPLTYAVEVAWRKGIVVVASAGNTGFGTPKLNNPAYDPYVIAVGASDHNGTVRTSDDFIADFSSRGELSRRPDFMAPGKQVVGLRVPGSYLDEEHPEARQGERFFRGSGTSQAAAVVSGSAALLLERNPELTPDQVKALFTFTGKKLTTSSGVELEEGARRIDVKKASQAVYDLRRGEIPYLQNWPLAKGTGSLDAARGTYRLSDGDNVLAGEIDIFGNAWDGSTWSGSTWSGSTWSGDLWLGRSWTGSTWSGRSWTGDLWLGRSWTGSTWSGSTWSGRSWTGSTWSGSTWSGRSWTGSTWSGSTWSSHDWSSAPEVAQ